jgi:hypothetical protein
VGRLAISLLTISVVVFAFVFGGSLVGIFLRARLPQEQLSPESRDVVKLGMGIIATMSAVVLGLLVASAKGYYDTQNHELTDVSARIVHLDRVLAHYGPEAKEARDLLRDIVVHLLDKIWRKGSLQTLGTEAEGEGAALFDKILHLSPQNDAQRDLRARALGLAMDLGENRWLMFEQASTSISVPLLLVVVFSLSITFASFTLHASPNPTVIATLALCAISVSATIFLILSMYRPFEGLIQVPSDPLRNALAQLGR